MGTLHNTHTGFFAAGSGAVTVHTTPGLLYALIATTAASADIITLYDSTSPSGDVLLSLNLRPDAPIRLFFRQEAPLAFWQGLTLNPSASNVYVLTMT